MSVVSRGGILFVDGASKRKVRTGSHIYCICSGPLSSLWGVVPLSMPSVLPKKVLGRLAGTTGRWDALFYAAELELALELALELGVPQ